MLKRLEDYFPDVIIGDDVQVLGIKNVSIGSGTCLCNDVWLNVCVRDDCIRMRIGRVVLVGRRSMISTGGELEIGDYTIIGPNVYIGDVDHDYRNNIQMPILLAGITDNQSIIIEENCWLAMNSVIAGNLTIGRGAVVGASTVVTSSVPPFSVVVGNPGKIIKMYDPVVKQWVATKTDKQRAIVEKNRTEIPLPTRSEYLKTLDTYDLNKLDITIAGGNRHIY